MENVKQQCHVSILYCFGKKVLYLQGFKANVITDGAVLHMVLLIRMHVEKVHNLVGLDSAFQEEDKKSASPANLQVVG